jgi:hypothetical protein
MVMLFPVQHASSGRNRHFASFSQRKTAYAVETVHDRRKILLEHDKETMVGLSTGDVTFSLGLPLAIDSDIMP